MSATPSQGDSLLVPSGPSGYHLHLIILGPCALAGYGSSPQLAMVGVTTLRHGVPHDPACVLRAGDHPFVRHESYLAYRYLRIDSVSHVQSMISSGAWKMHDPCSDSLLRAALAGLSASRLVPRAMKLALGHL